jgi:hypothetical protein
MVLKNPVHGARVSIWLMLIRLSQRGQGGPLVTAVRSHHAASKTLGVTGAEPH